MEAQKMKMEVLLVFIVLIWCISNLILKYFSATKWHSKAGATAASCWQSDLAAYRLLKK